MARTFDLGEFRAFRELRADKAQALKVLEEASEAYGAAADYAKAAYRGDAERDVPRLRARMLDECADLAQALANLLAAWRVDGPEWAEAVERCRERNEERRRY